MSWDVLIVNRREQIGEPPDEDLAPLGSADDVRRKISNALPGVDWSEPAWGVYQTAEYTIEFNAGDEETLESVMMHVRGGGNIAPDLARLGQATAWCLLDTSSGEYLDPQQPFLESWKATQAFREEVMGEVQAGLSELTEAQPATASASPVATATTAPPMSGSTPPVSLDRVWPEPEPATPPTPMVAAPQQPAKTARPARKAPVRKSSAPPPKKAAKRAGSKKAAPKLGGKKKTPAKKKAAARTKVAVRAKAPAKKKAAAKAAKKTRPAKKVARGSKKSPKKATKAKRR